MLLENALQQVSGIQRYGKGNPAIQGISYDSRSVRKGDLFKGENKRQRLGLPMLHIKV